MSAALAIDIGGTKVLCALVDGAEVLAHSVTETARGSGPAAWLDTAAELAADWAGRYDRVGLAVTGRVSEAGRWSALNPGTLNIPDDTPLTELAADRFGVPAMAVNDAQAAAWGEYRYGAGQGEDLVYLTISTGIGGGIVSGGQLLRGRGGIAGHFGQITSGDHHGARLESRTAGRWLTEAAAAAGHPTDARGVFEAAARGEPWAQDLRETAQLRVADLTADVQLMLDPVRIVMGGGIGLADGFLNDVAAHHAALAPALRPQLVAAQLGALAGAVGAAALANDFSSN